MTAALRLPHVVYDVLLTAVVLGLLWLLIYIVASEFRPHLPVQMLAPL